MTEQAEEALQPDGEGNFPIEDVVASIQNLDLQRRNRAADLDEAQQANLEDIRQVAITKHGAPESATWIYFTSPSWTWEQLCGREGWLLCDEATRTQHAFQMTVMN